MPDLSLLIAFRGRPHQLHSVIPLLAATPEVKAKSIQIVAVEVTSNPLHEVFIQSNGFKYLSIPDDGVFHKTRALNAGLELATGRFIAPFDVDLVPAGGSLSKLVELASGNPKLLFSGYRLMSNLETAKSLGEVEASDLSIAEENQPSALFKYLAQRQRFGVVPAFERVLLERIGGWDENFVGWGGEDQDIIERYLSFGRSAVLSHDLLYYHLHHQQDASWREAHLTDQNRRYYADLRSDRRRNFAPAIVPS